MKKLKIATVFSGIGAFEHALDRMSIKHETIFACDNGGVELDYDYEYHKKQILKLKSPQENKSYVDKLYSVSRRTNFVKRSYLENYKINDDMYFNDIRLINGKLFENQIDILVGGSPCQSFSIVGEKGGLKDTRGTLFYDFANLIKTCKPKIFIYENVRGLLTHDSGKTWKIMKSVFHEIGYDFKEELLNAQDYGIPQIRRRLFVVGYKKNDKEMKNFNFPKPHVNLELKMKDFLLSKVKYGNCLSVHQELVLKKERGIVDNKYILSPKLVTYVMKEGTKTFKQKVKIDLDIARTLLSTMGNRHRAGVDNYVTDLSDMPAIYKENPNNIRMLTEREAHRLMGFDDTYKIVVSRAQAYKQAGNSIVVNVMIEIIRCIYETGALSE